MAATLESSGRDLSSNEDGFAQSKSEIQSFYSNKTVLITGGTGFLGKILVEKLLRSCSDLKKIILIIREKKNKTAGERIKEYLNDPVFERLKSEHKDCASKIQGIQGDMKLENLGLRDDDVATLVSSVNVIFHTAATVKLKEDLRTAVDTNIRGLERLLEFADRFQNLDVFVHVSTAYSNCVRRKIEEKVYPPPVSPEHLISTCEKADDDLLNKLTPVLIGKWPNTYTFTKQIAETLVERKKDRFKVGIFRPGVVVSTIKEPVVGWIDNFYGPTGVIVSASMGLTRTMKISPVSKANVIPVDMVANALIASAFDVYKRSTNKIPVYNYTSVDNPVYWDEFFNKVTANNEYPLESAFWYMSFTFTSSELLYRTMVFVYHYIPAYVGDFFLLLCGKKTRFTQTVNKLNVFMNALTYFSTRNWDYEMKNTKAMWNRLRPDDKELFNFDISTIDWNDYLGRYMKGIKKYLLKEDMNRLEMSRLRYKRLYYMHQGLQSTIVGILLYVSWFVFRHFYKKKRVS